MNDQPSSKPNHKELSLDCIRYLQYSLAADFESVSLLVELLERASQVEWDSPTFIAASEEVRGHSRTSPLEGDNISVLRAWAYRLVELHARNEESAVSTIPTLEKIFADRMKVHEFAIKLIDHIEEISLLHIRMRDQLEMLNADVTPYGLPAIPKPLQ